MNFCGDIKKREKILNTNHFKDLKLSYLSRYNCSNYVNDKQKICTAVAKELILNYMLGKCYSKQSLLKGIFTLVTAVFCEYMPRYFKNAWLNFQHPSIEEVSSTVDSLKMLKSKTSFHLFWCKCSDTRQLD